MRFRSALVAIAIFFVGSFSAIANEPLTKRAEYIAGMEAMELGLTEVAMRKLGHLEASGNLTEAERSMLLPVLVESQVRAGRSDLALGVIEREPDLIPPFWRGLALAGQGRLEDAEAELSGISSEHLYAGEARLTRASLLRVLGRVDESARLLQTVAEGDDESHANRARIMLAQLELGRGNVELVHKALAPMLGVAYPARAEVDYLIAVAYLREKDFHRAHGALLRLQQSAGEMLTGNLIPAVPLALAEAEVGLDQIDAAVSRLMDLITETDDPQVLGVIFDRLFSAGAFEDEEIAAKMVEWAEGPNKNLAALASFHLAMQFLAQEDDDSALALLRQFTERFQDSYLLRRALTEIARIHVRNGQKDEALAALDSLGELSMLPDALGGELDFLRGQARFSSGEYAAASSDFERSALAGGDYELRLRAIHNAAVAAVKVGENGMVCLLFVHCV